MKINDDHMYHGAALIQIAEDDRFTAINRFQSVEGVSRSAFRINADIGVYLKYATKPEPSHDEYQFTFSPDQLVEITSVKDTCRRAALVLVCVKAREICCISISKFEELIERRKKKKGEAEVQYVLLVTAEQGKSFRVYVNEPGRRNLMLGKALVVNRSKFPEAVFA